MKSKKCWARFHGRLCIPSNFHCQNRAIFSTEEPLYWKNKLFRIEALRPVYPWSLSIGPKSGNSSFKVYCCKWKYDILVTKSVFLPSYHCGKCTIDSKGVSIIQIKRRVLLSCASNSSLQQYLNNKITKNNHAQPFLAQPFLFQEAFP